MTRRDTLFEYSIARAVNYEGCKDDGVGKGVIYAMSNNSSRFKRYDYVTVKVNINDVLVDQVVQVLMILNKIKNKINKYCSFATKIQLKFLSADLSLNLSQCLDDMVPFQLLNGKDGNTIRQCIYNNEYCYSEMEKRYMIIYL